MLENQMPQKSGFYNQLSQLNADFGEKDGFLIAQSFQDQTIDEECKACQEKVAITDTSFLRKFEIIGVDATIFVKKIFNQDLNRLACQELTQIALFQDNGEKIDEGNILKICPTHFRWIGSSNNSGNFFTSKILEWNLKVKITDTTDKINSLAVLGPLSKELLKKIIWTPPHQPNVEQLEKFRLTLARLELEQGISLVILRTDLGKKLGYEVFCSSEHAENLWKKIIQAGKEFGVIPIGFKALEGYFQKYFFKNIIK